MFKETLKDTFKETLSKNEHQPSSANTDVDDGKVEAHAASAEEADDGDHDALMRGLQMSKFDIPPAGLPLNADGCWCSDPLDTLNYCAATAAAMFDYPILTRQPLFAVSRTPECDYPLFPSE